MDQAGRKTDFTKFHPGAVALWFVMCRDQQGGFTAAIRPITPPPEAEPCTDQDQLSSWSALVDFAAWAPHSHRLRRKRTLCGDHLGQDGNLHLVEQKGPASFSEWEASSDVFVTAIMLEIVLAETLRRCGAHGAESRQSAWFFLLVVALSGRCQNLSASPAAGEREVAACAASVAQLLLRRQLRHR